MSLTHFRFGGFLLAALAAVCVSPVATAADNTFAADNVAMVRRLDPVYPLDLLLKGRTGWAEVRFMVDYTGHAVMTSVSGSSGGPFGQSLLAAIESNEFLPPRVNGQPQLTLATQRYEFTGEASLEPNEKRVLVELRKPMPAIATTFELDKPLATIHQDAPVYPYALQSDGISGRAEVEFIVDRDGHVVFPKIISATQDDFGWSAATAIARWRYQPPVKGGQKVDVRTKVVVNFDRNKGTATW